MIEILIEVFKGIVSIFLYFWWLFAALLALFAWQNRRKTAWVEKKEDIILEIKIPKNNDKTPTAAEMMFATLHGILKPKTELAKEGAMQDHLSFEIVADCNAIRFYVWTPKHLKDFVEGQIYAQYPSAEISETEDYSRKVEEGMTVTGSEILLTKADFLPIKTFNNFQVDPLAGITGVLSKLEIKGEKIWIQILARPVSDEWKRKGLVWINQKRSGGFSLEGNLGQALLRLPVYLIAEFIKAIISEPTPIGKPGEKKLSSDDETKISGIEEKSQKLGYAVKMRVIYLAPTKEKAGERSQAVFGAFKQYNTTNLNGFKGKGILNDWQYLKEYQNRLFLSDGFHLNIEELASIYHLPHTSVETPNINWTSSKTSEPPTTLPTIENTEPQDITLFGETNFRTNRSAFGIKRDDRRRHIYIIGKSGMGKTKLQEILIMNDINKGEGVAIIDPHGDLIRDALSKIPKERVNDVIIFDPADTNHPIAFNPMEVIDENMKVQIASGIVGTFKKIFGNSWGPRLEYILNYTVLALLDTPGSTILGIVRMLTDKNFRKKIVDNIQDPVVKKFWTTEFASYNEKFATEAIAPILNKVGQFVANSLIRNVIGQPKSSFNLRQAMDEGKIVLINLSVGRLGETNASLLGSLMITALQLAAMSRADIPESERRDFYLYVDEFQNFATESFATILSEARKYHLNLTMANQYVAQMEETGVKDAIFGNVGTLISFRVGAQDAGILAKEFNPPFEEQDLINLPRQCIYVRMTINGQSEPAFSAKVITVNNETTGVMDEIVNNSRSLYTKPKEEAEQLVAEWANIEMTKPNSTNVTNEIKEEIEAAKDAIEEGGETMEDFFEAPLVKNIGKKKKKDKSALADIIRENTAHVEKKNADKVEKAPDKKGEKEEKSTEPAMKIKDKIDKEILSEILKSVVTPQEKINNNISEIKPEKNNEENRGEQKKEKTVNKTDKNKIDDLPTSTKHEKIITPENFKHIKEIHPHEVVKVVTNTETDSKTIDEGEQVRFE